MECILVKSNDGYFRPITSLRINSKILMDVAGTQPEMFQRTGGFMELGHFHKYFFYCQKQKKKVPCREFFLIDTLKTTF